MRSEPLDRVPDTTEVADAGTAPSPAPVDDLPQRADHERQTGASRKPPAKQAAITHEPASSRPRRRRVLRPYRATMPDADEVLRELRALADRGVRVVPNEIRAALGDGIIKACYAHFGSLPAARTAAGIAKPRRETGPTISRGEVLTVLRAEVARRNGIPPKADDLSPVEQRSVRAHFGGHAAALAVLGLHPRSGRWTRDTVIAELRAWRASGKPLSSNVLNEERLDLWNAVLRHVGSFREAWALVGEAVADAKPPTAPANARSSAGRGPKATAATVADQATAAARSLEARVRALAVAIAQAAIAQALAEVEQDVRARLAAVTWTPT